jgi:chorismate mutase
MKEIEKLRKNIDKVDRVIIDALFERFQLVQQIGEAKKNLG